MTSIDSLIQALQSEGYEPDRRLATAVFLALNPITAIALGALLLGEPVSMRLLLGLAAVLAGIQLASRARPARASSAREPSASGDRN